MAAIPSGFVDCNVTVDHTGSCTLRARAVGYQTFIHVTLANGLDVEFVVDPSGAVTDCGDWDTAATVELAYWAVFGFSENYAGRHVHDSVSGACPQPYLEVDLSWSITGLRLIAGLDTTAGAKNLQYKLFSDENTTWELVVGATTYTTTGTTFGAATALTSLGVSFSTTVTRSMGGFVGSAIPLSDGLQIQNAVWNGSADPTTSDDLAFEGTSAAGSNDIAHTHTSEPPLEYGVDVRVENAAGGTPIRDVRVENVGGQGVTVANPGTGSVTLWRPGGTDRFWVAGTLDGVWASSGIEPVVRAVPLRQIVPKRPSGAPEQWTPLTLSVASPIEMLLSGDVWTKTGLVALSGVGNSTWTVTGAGTVSRALRATYDSADGYTRTLHAAGDDVWGAGLFSYLELSLTASVSATLTLTITYNTNPATGATATETYTLSVASGTQDVRVDMLFPDGGGPTYYERITNLSLSGFSNGTYTLNSCRLVADERVYVKVAAAVQWSGLTLAADGSFGAMWWGENPVYSGSDTRKEEECAEFGGAQQTLGGCVRMDGTLSSLATELNKMEGVTAIYSGAVIDADLTDGTNVFANLTSADYLASWLHAQMGLRVAPNAALPLAASMRFDQCILVPANAGQIVLPFRETIGMMLEAQCVDAANARAGAGFPMVARRSATGTPNPADPVIGGGATDASGFVSVPIPVGQVSGPADFYCYLEGAG